MSARVLLMRLSCRTSSKGREYLSGYLGCSRVVAFKAAEPDKFGNEQWEVYVAEPEPKGEAEQRQAPRQEQAPAPRHGTDRAGRYDPAPQQRQRHVQRARAQAAGEAIAPPRDDGWPPRLPDGGDELPDWL
jgi:hypothetical protein